MQSLSIVRDLWFFLKGCRWYSGPYPVSCLIGSKAPGGEVNYRMTRRYPGREGPQLREWATNKQEQTDPGTEDGLWDSQDAAGRATDGQQEGDRAARHTRPQPPPSKLSALRVSRGWTDVHHPHCPPQLLASEIQQTSLSTSLACWLLSGKQPAPTGTLFW